jgi:hypothetical protein
MIQRKQTLFLFQLIFLGIALLFIPCAKITTPANTYELLLIPINNPEVHSSAGHLAAVFINFGALVLAFVAVFLYKQRLAQLRLCYVIIFFWIVLMAMIAYCPFISSDVPVTVEVNYLSLLIGAFAVLAAFLAARYIKRDIELLKSADRVR